MQIIGDYVAEHVSGTVEADINARIIDSPEDRLKLRARIDVVVNGLIAQEVSQRWEALQQALFSGRPGAEERIRRNAAATRSALADVQRRVGELLQAVVQRYVDEYVHGKAGDVLNMLIPQVRARRMRRSAAVRIAGTVSREPAQTVDMFREAMTLCHAAINDAREPLKTWLLKGTGNVAQVSAGRRAACRACIGRSVRPISLSPVAPCSRWRH